MKKSNKFNSKIIWITGSSSGIGEATAYEFAKQGAKLILTALEADILENVKVTALQLGASAVEILPFDLSFLDELNNLANEAVGKFGRIDLLYNNAGISQRSNTIDTSMKVIRKIMDINYFAPVILTKALLPKMIEQGGGQLVVTTSIAGKFGFPLRCAYSSSKHALYGFFETIQAEYFHQNIKVTIVCPGRVQTKISFYALEKDGIQHGKMDKGQAGGVTPEYVAKKIIKALCREKREVLIGKKELLMVHIKRFFPNLAAKIIKKIEQT